MARKTYWNRVEERKNNQLKTLNSQQILKIRLESIRVKPQIKTKNPL
jgi:hypothetical protein